MDSVKITLNETMVTVLLSLLSLFAAMASYGCKKLAEKFDAQKGKIKDEGERQLFENALFDVEKLTTTTINCIEQTTAKAMRQAVKDGKTDRAELVALSSQAAQEITAAIKPEAKQIIADNLGSFEGYLEKLIEDKVLAVKQNPPVQ